jgi:predicted Zn-dependent protease
VPAIAHAVIRARVWLGDHAGALSAAERAVERNEGPLAQDDLVGVLLAAGDFGRAERVLRERQRKGPLTTYMEAQLANAILAQGRRAEGRRALEARARQLRDTGETADAASSPVFVLEWSQPAERAAAAEEALRLDPAQGYLAVYLAYCGQLAEAERHGAGLEPGSVTRQKLDAVLAWKRGDPGRAAALLRAADERDPYGQDYGMLPSFLLAEASAATGDWEGAAAATRRYLSFWPRGLYRSWAYPRSVFLLALAQERVGRRAEARSAIDVLLHLWKNADPGIPLLAEARALRGRLADAGIAAGRSR